MQVVDYDVVLKIIATVILLIGMIDDLYSRKIHNKLILILLPVVLLSVFTVHAIKGDWIAGFQSLVTVSLVSGFIALLIGIPLHKLKILGGGDVKLYFVFSLAVSWNATIGSILLSFVWGSLLGIFMSILKNQWKNLIQNIVLIAKLQKPKQEKLQFLPFSVVLFLGWISFQVLKDLHLV